MIILKKDIETKTLIEYEDSVFNFFNTTFVSTHNFNLHKLKTRSSVEVIDRREIEGGDIEHLESVKIMVYR